MAAKTVVIDCFPESAGLHRDKRAIVAIDVLRATTTAVTAVSLGFRCYPVPSLEAAVPLAARLDNPLLVGEVGGKVPYGFDLSNSPTALSQLDDRSRPVILLSTSGTKLLWESLGAAAVYAACLRNFSAVAAYVSSRHEAVAVIGAGARGEFREEDALCCAWVAALLIEAGFTSGDAATEQLIERWSGADVEEIRSGNSARYLANTGQVADLDFVVSHVDDLEAAHEFDKTTAELVGCRALP
jgi:2-phosphosulfolactate phosphatase